eukprot:COSAG02_NODE_29983_length_559_cov_0.995652_1_plen_99_part_10
MATRLFEALDEGGSIQEIHSLLKQHPEAAREELHGVLAFHWALKKGSSNDVVEALLDAHSPGEAQKQTRDARLALHLALINQSSEKVVLTLLDKYPEAV